MSARSRIFRQRRLPSTRPLAALVAGLFANGEQGLWYDPTDLSTMYQDAAGTLPVYAPGQGQVDPPVGLILDKRKGLVRGTELLPETTFANAANWMLGAGWSIDASNRAVATSVASGVYVQLAIALRPTTLGNTWYEAVVTVDSVTAGGFGVHFANALQATISSPGTYRFLVPCAADGKYLTGILAAGTTTGVISSFSVRPLPGNHAYQTTTTSRPTLSARYNLLTATEQFSAAAWVKVDAGVAISANVAVAPDGTMTADQMTVGVGLRGIRQDATFSGTGTLAVYVKAAPSNSATHVRVSTNNASAWNTGQSKKLALTSSWQRLDITGALNSSGTAVRISIGTVDAAGNADADCYGSVLIWGADLRVANDGVGLPPYQRVVDASTYDTAGFPLYLKFDGTDDWMQTSSVDFSGTDKMAVCASVRKLSDATTGMLVELSSTIANNAGAMYITAPGVANTANIKLATKGTIEVNVATGPSAFPSPVSAVVSGFMDISASVSTLRVNGSIAQTSSLSLGTGALGNYPLYIGRRGGSLLPFNGRLCGLLIRGGAITDGQIANVERYLNSKARSY